MLSSPKSQRQGVAGVEGDPRPAFKVQWVCIMRTCALGERQLAQVGCVKNQPFGTLNVLLKTLIWNESSSNGLENVSLIVSHIPKPFFPWFKSLHCLIADFHLWMNQCKIKLSAKSIYQINLVLGINYPLSHFLANSPHVKSSSDLVM